jgi:hypothetical protein
MNTQNERTVGETTLPSPLPMRQLFSASAPPVESRTNPTKTAAAMSRQSGNAIDNNCTIINIATYNIRDGQNSNLEVALKACKKIRIDIGVLTETKLSTDRYTLSAYGYTVFASKTTHINQGGNLLTLYIFRLKHNRNMVRMYSAVCP